MLAPMTRDEAPQDVIDLAEARADARRARDWTTADTLLARIQAAGWRVIDAGTLYSLERVAPADVEVDGVIRYGASTSVPSRLDEAPTGVATVVLPAPEWSDDVDRAGRAILDHAPEGMQLVVVAGAPDPAPAAIPAWLADPQRTAGGALPEVVWTSGNLGFATTLNIGIRRAVAPVVLLLDPCIEAAGDVVTPLVAALADETVAVAGPVGLVSADMRRFVEAPVAAIDVDAIDGSALAFRRADYLTRGPLDERFTDHASLDVWWSLLLRDQDDDAAEAPARRAVQVRDLPFLRHERRTWPGVPDDQRERVARKSRYRVLKRFATRRDLLTGT